MYDRKFVRAVTLPPKLPIARWGSGFRGQSSFPEIHQNSNFGYLARSQSALFRSFLCTFFLGCIKHIRVFESLSGNRMSLVDHVQFVYFSVIKCSSSSLHCTLPFFPFRVALCSVSLVSILRCLFLSPHVVRYLGGLDVLNYSSVFCFFLSLSVHLLTSSWFLGSL